MKSIAPKNFLVYDEFGAVTLAPPARAGECERTKLLDPEAMSKTVLDFMTEVDGKRA